MAVKEATVEGSDVPVLQQPRGNDDNSGDNKCRSTAASRTLVCGCTTGRRNVSTVKIRHSIQRETHWFESHLISRGSL